MAKITTRKKLKWTVDHDKFHNLASFSGVWQLPCMHRLFLCLSRFQFDGFAELPRAGPVAAMSYARADCQLDANVLLSELAVAIRLHSRCKKRR